MFHAALQEDAFAQAWQLYEQQDWSAAYTAFSVLFRNQPGNLDINLAYALAAKQAGRLPHAALALERVLQMAPTHQRARVELAETYYLIQQYELADEQFELVLATDPPEAVQHNIERYQEQIQAKIRRWNGYIQLRTGIFHDDNINVGPADALISINPIQSGNVWIDTLNVDPESQPQEAWGCYGALSLVGERAIGARGGAWSIYGFSSAYQSILDGQNDYEMGYYQGAAGVQHQTRNTLLQLPLRAEYISRGHTALARIYGITPTHLYARTPTLHLISSANAEYRDYADSTDYTGGYYSLGESMRYFRGASRHSLSVGLRLIREQAREEVYSNWAAEGSLTANLNILPKTALYGLFQYKYAAYDGTPALAEEDRNDGQWLAACGLHRRLSQRWALDMNFRYTHNQSSFDLYTYHRQVISLNTTCSF